MVPVATRRHERDTIKATVRAYHGINPWLPLVTTHEPSSSSPRCYTGISANANAIASSTNIGLE